MTGLDPFSSWYHERHPPADYIVRFSPAYMRLVYASARDDLYRHGAALGSRVNAGDGVLYV
jgi:hypothetical protein